MAPMDLQTLAQKRADLESRLARADNALREARRRDDARRKIVLGGALLAALRAGDIPAATGRALVARYVSERDRPLFAGTSIAVVSETDGATS